jgi:hypothetical protein
LEATSVPGSGSIVGEQVNVAVETGQIAVAIKVAGYRYIAEFSRQNINGDRARLQNGELQ